MDQSLDKDSIAKLVANGFAVTKDGSVWINKGHVDSGKLIDFNTLTQHEISHIVFGEDSEYEAQYVEAAYGEFLEGIRDSGYLEDGEGLIDYKMSMLVDEDWARLNGYTEEDMQFKLLSGDDEVDDRHNLGGKYGTKDQSNKSFYRELNRVRKIERTVNTKRRRINQYKEKNRDREKDSKYYRDLEKEAARISAEEEEKLRLSNSYDEVLQVSYDEYLARKYVSEKIGRREELSDYRVILLSVESDGSVIILHTSGDPLEKAGNEYNERVNKKNSLYGIQGRNYEKLFHPISEMEGMIRQGQIVKYESGKLFSPVAYGMNYELARLNYEERFERGIKGTLQVGLGTMRTAIGGAMLSGSGICASMSSGLCLNAVTVQMAALGASEVGFGINDMILGGSNIGSAYSSSKDTGYDFVKEYKALRTAGPTSNPSLGKELNILKGFLGENYDMMNTSSMMTGGMYGLGMAEYYVRNQRQDEFKILGNNRIFINDGTPGGTGEVKSVTVGNSRYIINKIYSPSSDSAVIKVLNRATGEVSSTVINGSTVAERALTQIGNTAGYDLVSRMNTPPKYPLVVYEPRVEALSTVNYINTLSNVQDLLNHNVSKKTGGMVLNLNLQLFASKTPNVTFEEISRSINTRQPGYFLRLQDSRNYGYTPTQEYWRNVQASRNVGNVTTPINYNHVLNLEINRRNRVVGGHAANGNVVVGNVLRTYPSGVYEAEVFMPSPSNSNILLPKSNNGGISTLTPNWWTNNRVIYEFNNAYLNRTEFQINKNGQIIDMWKGQTPSGIHVEGYLNPVTVYPQK